MPAVSKAKTPCIIQLANELAFASKPTLLRHLQRIDELAPQIDTQGVYPQDWIVFRITGYRPNTTSPDLIPGQALIGDLSAIAEHLSEAAKLTADDIHHPHETIDSLTKRWSVSRKTIERYRRLGLIARRIDLGSGHRSIIFMQEAVEWFESLNAKRLGYAARFDRITDSQLAQFKRWAIGYRRHLNWSRSQAAARIALRTGHSHEGVRKALLRIDAQATKKQTKESTTPIFTDPAPTNQRDHRFALRAALRGIEPSAIAIHTNRSKDATLRAINAARAQLIRSFDLPTRAEPTPQDPTLTSAPACQELTTFGDTDLCALIKTMRQRTTPIAYEEHARAWAYSILLHQASTLSQSLKPSAPSSTTLDEIETSLRHAGLLKAKLIEPQLHLILSTIEIQIGGQIDTLDPSRAAFLLLGAIRVAAAAIDRFNPSHKARIAAPVGLAVTRFASQQSDIAQPTVANKATRRILPGYTIANWTHQITPWHRWLMPDPRIESVVNQINHPDQSNQLSERDQLILTHRYGFAGSPPIKRTQLATLLNTSTIHAARFERTAIHNALQRARDQNT